MLIDLLSLYIASILNSSFPALAELYSASFYYSQFIENSATPIKNQKFISPVIEAKSSIAIDLATGNVLFEKNAHKKMQIASITKLMTLLIILEENKLTDVIAISNNAASVSGSEMFLRQGEQITLENLIYGALIGSANDAAVALAEYNAGNVKKFVDKMNKKAKLLGLINTHFANPMGLDNQNNYSSSYDVAVLGKLIYKNEFIKKTATIKEIEVKSIDSKYTHKIQSTNELLDSYLKIKGLKTGKTDLAGLCLVAIAENDKGNEILTIVLNSPNRFRETKILVDWIFRAYNWQ